MEHYIRSEMEKTEEIKKKVVKECKSGKNIYLLSSKMI